jgi:hypothetical protein
MGCYNNYLCSYLVTCTDNGQPCGGTIPDPPPDVPTDDEDYDKDTISIVINDAADSIADVKCCSPSRTGLSAWVKSEWDKNLYRP